MPANLRAIMRNFIFILALVVAASAAPASDEQSIRDLGDALAALSPGVSAKEAALVAVTAHTTSRRLAREYRFVSPPDFHNFLIHLGLRQRGFCYDWVRDIGARLKELKPRTLALHWGAALVGTWRENNCLVLTARGQSFNEGIVIDGWRKSAPLWWRPVSQDHEYLWHEDVGETAWLQDYRPRERRPKKTADVREKTGSLSCFPDFPIHSSF
jgi:hypothetical protein